MNLGIAIELVLFPFGFEIFFSLLCAFEIQNFLWYDFFELQKKSIHKHK